MKGNGTGLEGCRSGRPRQTGAARGGNRYLMCLHGSSVWLGGQKVDTEGDGQRTLCHATYYGALQLASVHACP